MIVPEHAVVSPAKIQTRSPGFRVSASSLFKMPLHSILDEVFGLSANFYRVGTRRRFRVALHHCLGSLGLRSHSMARTGRKNKKKPRVGEPRGADQESPIVGASGPRACQLGGVGKLMLNAKAALKFLN